jgi:hypothetical protein
MTKLVNCAPQAFSDPCAPLDSERPTENPALVSNMGSAVRNLHESRRSGVPARETPALERHQLIDVAISQKKDSPCHYAKRYQRTYPTALIPSFQFIFFPS